MVPTRRVNRRTVQEALDSSDWHLDIQGDLTFTGLLQLMNLRAEVERQGRNPNEDDVFRWSCAISGAYSARETYDTLQETC